MRTRTIFQAAGAITAVGAATLAYASLIERGLYTIRRFDVPILAGDEEPLRVLHISDLHLTPGQRRKQEWVAALAGLDPDLIIITGDNIAHVDSIPAVIAAYTPLYGIPGAFIFGSNDYRGPVFKNPLGYFNRDREYVQGAHLPYEQLRQVLTDDAGWADLNNARTVLKAGGRKIEIVGVDDPHVERDDYPAVAGRIDRSADAHLAILHSPEPRVLNQMAGDGFQLMLAGHTHGGQVRVPGVGALVTNCGLDRRMARGLHRWPGSDSFLHVSAGLGTHPTAPIRFACRPEVSLLTLIPR